MAVKKTEETRLRNIANIASIALVVFLGAAFVLEVELSNLTVNYSFAGLVMIIALVIIIVIQRNSINKFKMAFNVPFTLFLFYTALMMLIKWNSTHYLFICISFCAISCIYSNFNRTLAYIILSNGVMAFLFIR